MKMHFARAVAEEENDDFEVLMKAYGTEVVSLVGAEVRCPKPCPPIPPIFPRPRHIGIARLLSCLILYARSGWRPHGAPFVAVAVAMAVVVAASIRLCAATGPICMLPLARPVCCHLGLRQALCLYIQALCRTWLAVSSAQSHVCERRRAWWVGVSGEALQVDRIEAEVMQLVPGVRYVDLETDRGRFSTYARTALVKEVEDVRAETFAPPPPAPNPNGAMP